MTEVDVGRLSYAELLALRAKLDREIEDKRGEELKVLADGFAKKVQAAGFSVAEAMGALRPYVGPAIPGNRAVRNGPLQVLYRDPANPENTWSGRGRAARWLADYEAKGHHRNEFRVGSF
ncbi:H-NS histone family protein [Paucibacter sp. XJ19-41]|uniref:H-NS histone family protein n=1 Tax=Paucibacter sp. XJ19-41 TaxID=2927824 RepID=UPI0023499A6A|nr:H-NS histone family protein [Paucibacter sp. XJ19-41]MDC6166569.1 H-NS histone family protein [Paucibacter sp. XJ19-41]